MLAILKARFMFSKYLETLYQKSKATETPFFVLNSQAVHIIEDPLDFYALLNVPVKQPRAPSPVPPNGSASPVSTSPLGPWKGTSSPASNNGTNYAQT